MTRFGKLLPVLSLLAILIAFSRILPELFAAWQTDEYSHGLLIPFIAALLGWHLLAENRPAIRPSWWGGALLIVAGLLLLVGRLAAFTTAAEYGSIVALIGLALATLGARAAFLLLPAFIYLGFAVPLPHLAYATLSQDLQLLSSTLGVKILDALGIPVYQEGNVIDLGGLKLQVVEACSGLRYLFPLMSFGYLVAFLLRDRWWKRAAIFLSTIPITIATNSLRIALIGVTVDRWGNAMAGGLIHDIEGWVIFLICALVLMAEVWLLLRLAPGGRFRYEYLGLAHGPLVTGIIRPSPPGIAVLALAIALIFTGRQVDKRQPILPAHAALAGFPLMLGDWQGTAQKLDPDMLAGLQLSDYFLADYKRQDTPPVDFYIAYYASQRVGSATHSPANCIPGGGWQIARSDVVTLPVGLKVSRLLIRKGDAAQLVYYWFDERGRDLTETTVSKWYMMIDSVTLHRTDGALIRLVTALGPHENEAEAQARLNDFLARAYPAIGTFVPGR